MTTPRVAIIGKFNHLYWDFYVANAFRQLGCEVNHFQYNRYPPDILALRVLMQACTGKRRMRKHAVAWSVNRWHHAMELFRPHIVFVPNAFFIPLEYYQRAHQISSHPKVSAWDGDGGSSVANAPYYPFMDIFFESGTDYKRIHPAADFKIETLFFAADTSVYTNAHLPRENKLYFCGNWTPGRDEVLSALVDFPVVLKGWGWNNLSTKGKSFEISEGTVSVPELVADYNRYQFVLNTHQAGPYMGMNMRTFEAPACGACQICDKRDGLDMLFTDGVDILVYDNLEVLRARIQWVFDHPAEVQQIAERGCLRVQDQHTYLHRAKQVLTSAKNLH